MLQTLQPLLQAHKSVASSGKDLASRANPPHRLNNDFRVNGFRPVELVTERKAPVTERYLPVTERYCL
ncbi:hypothetical protein, partial [Salinivibrio socompensis]|uniref:hypothetical protein n=1 Tax=Salinivibrio socompensis TaxID=1510206 RepID=UPI001969BE23